MPSLTSGRGTPLAQITKVGRSSTGAITVSRPDVVSGPAAGAEPVVVLSLLPQGGSCAQSGTPPPELVIYSDGATLTSAGSACLAEKLPATTTGWIDPQWVYQRMNSYFLSDQSRVVMTSSAIELADGTTAGIADDATTDLTYTASDNSVHHAAAYALDISQLGMEPAVEQAGARAAFVGVVGDLTARAKSTTLRTPTALTITVPPTGVPKPAAAASRWPLPPSGAVARLFSSGVGTYTVLTGKDATLLLKAQQGRPSDSSWLISGKTRDLAVGVKLAGVPACRG